MISRRQFLKLMAALGASAVLTSGYALAGEPLMRPRITRYGLAPPRWPAGLKLTIAVLADIHACRPWMDEERIASIVARTNELGADLVVLLGDYVAGHRYVTGGVDADDWAQALGGLRAPLGVHAILGNHDWWIDRTVMRAGHGDPFSRRALENAGIPVYQNEAVRLTKSGASFWLAGLGDQLAFWPWRKRHPGRRWGVDDLPRTLAPLRDDAPVILLAHEPDIAVRVPDRVSLVLSGHTHGGQVRLLGWSPVVPSRYGNRFSYGHIRVRRGSSAASSELDLIVSGGLGCSIVPLRLGVPPEIVLVTLGADATGLYVWRI